MRMPRAALLLAALLLAAPCAGSPTASWAAGAKKDDGHGKGKADAHGKPEAPPAPKEKIEPLPIVEPAKLPSGRHAFEMMRELRQLQDKVANGETDAILAQRPLIEKMAEEFEKADDAVWTDPRNGRAVLTYVLSGGDVKVLRGLLMRGQPKSIEANLGRAIHAFASNRRGDALEHFGKIDPFKLDATIAGPLALAQAEFAARTDVEKALEKLDVARLLGTGSLIEEAALRRKISILSGQKKFVEADRMMEIYFRRFPRSGYSGGMKRQVLRFVADRPQFEGDSQPKAIIAALGRLAPRDRLEMYVEMTKEAAGRARRDIVTFAGEQVLALAEDGSPAQARAKVYMAALQVASLESVKVRASLEDMKPTVSGKDELELIAAAQSIADEINRVGTVTPTDNPDPTWRNELGTTFTNVGKAHSALADADRLLSEAAK